MKRNENSAWSQVMGSLEREFKKGNFPFPIDVSSVTRYFHPGFFPFCKSEDKLLFICLCCSNSQQNPWATKRGRHWSLINIIKNYERLRQITHFSIRWTWFEDPLGWGGSSAISMQRETIAQHGKRNMTMIIYFLCKARSLS